MAAILADIFKCTFVRENDTISIQISLKYYPRSPIDSKWALVQVIAWCQRGDKPLSELMMIILLTHIFVTRPQWGNTSRCFMLFEAVSEIDHFDPCPPSAPTGIVDRHCVRPSVRAEQRSRSNSLRISAISRKFDGMMHSAMEQSGFQNGYARPMFAGSTELWNFPWEAFRPGLRDDVTALTL